MRLEGEELQAGFRELTPLHPLKLCCSWFSHSLTAEVPVSASSHTRPWSLRRPSLPPVFPGQPIFCTSSTFEPQRRIQDPNHATVIPTRNPAKWYVCANRAPAEKLTLTDSPAGVHSRCQLRRAEVGQGKLASNRRSHYPTTRSARNSILTMVLLRL